jgi:hypothetical protein
MVSFVLKLHTQPCALKAAFTTRFHCSPLLHVLLERSWKRETERKERLGVCFDIKATTTPTSKGKSNVREYSEWMAYYANGSGRRVPAQEGTYSCIDGGTLAYSITDAPSLCQRRLRATSSPGNSLTSSSSRPLPSLQLPTLLPSPIIFLASRRVPT